VGVDAGGEVARTVRGLGWLLIVVGAVVLLYVVYLLWFTNLGADGAQRDLADRWATIVPDDSTGGGSGGSGGGDLDGDALASDDPAQAVPPARDDESTEDPATDPATDDGGGGGGGDQPALAGADGVSTSNVRTGDAFAAMWFERDGRRILTDVLYVVEGTDWETLKLGPGRYGTSDVVGGAGNLAIAGHRQGWGAPFYDLDKLREGDRIHVVDRDGREWIYRFRAQRIVAPDETWVIGPDPFDDGAALVTLTTCHPLFSNATRLIVWGELIGDPRPSEMPALSVGSPED
jgi:sortase A